ncbi:MAG: indole-3-glycerol phosphate synthase TrpC [Lachnospiraceae bacterium]|nr:indole-3-glycerol phosphate synthase TrpC [Lachnospiraceae bacterium]
MRFEQIDILSEIAAKTKLRVNEQLNMNNGALFTSALTQNKINFICEVKKASPSLGVICDDFDYIGIAKDYESAGAAAISVLTEPFYFKGSNDYLSEISQNIKLPLLRKDFIVDEYMIYEAKFLGASAILLICAILDDTQIKKFIKTAEQLGLAVLTEVHDETEVKRALDLGAKIIGVNNRNLKTFEVDLKTSERLRKYIPDEIIFVAESGIKTRDDVKRLEQIGVNAVLIGETLMRSACKKAELNRLKGL